MPRATDGLTIDERFDFYVDKSGECWIWTGATFNGRYGAFGVGNRKTVGAHRYAFEREHGPLAAGLFVCHTCDNPRCVRPAHLFAGTPRDNTTDMVNKGRLKVAVGMRHYKAKITPEEITMIKDLAGTLSQAEIGRRFGINQSHVCRILKGAARAHD